MKKLVSVFLAVVMLTMCAGISGFAADVSFGASSFEELIDILDRNMPETQAGRVEVFDVLEVYMSTDGGMNALVDMVDNLTASGDDSAFFEQIITRLGTDLAENQDTVLFILDLLRALPAEDRADAVAAFRDAQDAVDSKSAELGIWWATEAQAGVLFSADDAFQTALANVYNYYVGNEEDPAEDGTEKLGSHGIGPNTILNLALAFKGNIELTDDAEDSTAFAVKTVADEFKTGLYTSLSDHFTSINGVELTSGNEVLAVLLSALNELPESIRADIKTVLGVSGLALYAPLDEEDSDSTSRPGTNRPIGGYLGGSDTVDMSKEIGNITPNTSTQVSEPASAEAAYIYTDTADHWAKDYVGELSKRGIFTGYGDGSFKPDSGITREEMAVALTRALDVEDKAKRAPYCSYTDSSYVSTWALDAVNLMSKLGVFTGYDDGSFKPQQVITREQMVAVIMRMFDDSTPKTALNHIDSDAIGYWAKDYVMQASTLSIVSGYPDGTFRPANSITRAEAAKILYAFMHYADLL